MNKEDILKEYDKPTGIIYKFQPLYVGDVYENELGVKGIVLLRHKDGKAEYYYKKVNNCEHWLPSEKCGMNKSKFVANVVQDDELMSLFIDKGIIKEGKSMTEETKEVENVVADVTKEVKPKKTVKKETKEPTMNIYQKINAIRKTWAESNVDKEGQGRAGGGAKYDYYKPQQIIDFCLKEELKHNIYSKFSVTGDICYYEITNLDNIEEKEAVMCPFDIPRKMAASEAQQVGAAMTYHNRRLAMMMYKIEDNSKESVNVMEDADYSKPVDIPAPPVIPQVQIAEPVIQQAPVIEPTVEPIVEPTNAEKIEQVFAPTKKVDVDELRRQYNAKKQEVKLEVSSEPVNEIKNPDVQIVAPTTQNTVSVNLATENGTSEPVVEVPKMGSIESLY